MSLFAIFLEGDDDERIVKWILNALFYERFDSTCIDYYQWSQKKDIQIRKYIQTIESINNWDYMFIQDIDLHPSINSCIDSVRRDKPYIECEKIYLIIPEIEAWYMAGLSQEFCETLRIPFLSNTDGVTKEQFTQIFNTTKSNDEINSLLQFKLFIMDHFDLDIALGRNSSLQFIVNQFHNIFI